MSSPDVTNKTLFRRVAAAVMMGTTIEWYDFMLYSLASATVFGPLFFPSFSNLSALLLSFSTFAVGFAARPVGAVVFGHFGDRLGRKRMLVISLTLMGVATTLIGALPTYETIGIAAPILLVFFRLLQGFSVGGEWGGAVNTAVEYAPTEKRSLYGSLPQTGLPAGLILANVAFLGASSLPQTAFLTWGWRIPFFLSGALVFVGLYARHKIDETPVFNRLQQSKSKVRFPVVTALRTHTKMIFLMIAAVMGSGVYFYGVNAFAIAYATNAGYLTESQTFAALIISAVTMGITIPFMGQLAQRYRQQMVKWVTLSLTPWVFVVFASIQSGNVVVVGLVFIAHGVIYGALYAALATFIVDRFPPHIRYSVGSIVYNFGGLLGGSLAPFISTALLGFTGSIWIVCVYSAIFSTVGFVAAHAIGPVPARDETSLDSMAMKRTVN